MKVSWSFDGKTSKTKIEVRDDTKICSECSGFDGHFNECSKLDEIKWEEEQVRLLRQSLKELKN